MLASLVIVFREAIEAGLIVGIVLAATRGVTRRGRWVSSGVAAGALGACAVAAFAGELGALFNGSGQEVFNAVVLLAAVGMLTWHNAWMAGHGRELAREVRAIGTAVAEGDRPLTALAFVVGLAVLREGAEVVLFLYGIFVTGGASVGAMLAGGLLGVALGAAMSASDLSRPACGAGTSAVRSDHRADHTACRRTGRSGRVLSAAGRLPPGLWPRRCGTRPGCSATTAWPAGCCTR